MAQALTTLLYNLKFLKTKYLGDHTRAEPRLALSRKEVLGANDELGADRVTVSEYPRQARIAVFIIKILIMFFGELLQRCFQNII